MKRKFSVLVIVAILMLFVFALPCNAAQTVKVINDGSQLSVEVNGSQVNFDQPPSIINGRTMVPFRAIAEALGASVDWDSANNKVIISGKKKVELVIGSTTALVNGNEFILDTPATVIGGRTMVPIRFLGEALGAEVTYILSAVQTIQQSTSGSLLPDEEKIQGMLTLTQADIQRLRSYSKSSYVQEDLKKYPASKQAEYGKYIFNENFLPPYLKAVTIMQNDLFTVDYEKLSNPAFAEEFKRKYYGVTVHDDCNEAIVNQYIPDSIASKLKIKAYFVTSRDVICQASPKFTSVRAKYFFYQYSGTKLEVEGSSLNRWYCQDVEIHFVIPMGKWEGNTIGVGWVYNIRNLNSPQPIDF